MGVCGCTIPRPGGCEACNPLSFNFIGYSHPIHTQDQKGWICPNCNMSNAPWKPWCCNNQGESNAI